MKRYLLLCMALFLTIVLSSCQTDPVTAPASDATSAAVHHLVDPTLVAAQMVQRAGWPAEDGNGQPVQIDPGLAPDKCLNFTREVVFGDVVHYSLILQVGPTEHDIIGIHRVVRESRPLHPIKTKQALFMDHGGSVGFVSCFLPGLASPVLPDDFGAALYLAEHDVDVWGIDHSYILVPDGTTDFTFMADWDMQWHVDCLATAIEIARQVRKSGGNGYKQILLEGLSDGAMQIFAYSGAEAQLAPGQRKVNGLISWEFGLVTDAEWQTVTFCWQLDEYLAAREDGIFGAPELMREWGFLARDNPDGYDLDPSGTLTNLEFFLTACTGPAYPPDEGHYWAGTFDSEGLVTGLQYTTVQEAIELWCTFAYSMIPFAKLIDGGEINCPGHHSQWTDYLADVTVPIFQLSTVGGFGVDFGRTLELVGSTDITVHDVRLHPVGEEGLDFGHVDMISAHIAADVAWQPMLEWIQTHHHR